MRTNLFVAMSGQIHTFQGQIQDFRKGDGSQLLLTTKMRCNCAHAGDVFCPLYEVWGSPKSGGSLPPRPPPPGSAPAFVHITACPLSTKQTYF